MNNECSKICKLLTDHCSSTNLRSQRMLSIYQIHYLREYILHFGEFIDVVYNFCATLTQDRNRRDHLTLSSSSSEADHKSDCNYIYVEKLRSCKWIFMCDRLESIYNESYSVIWPKKPFTCTIFAECLALISGHR